MVKIDLITGFLGSGKTTFIKKYATYLMQQGMLNRTSRGRIATRETYRYLGMPFPENQ